ncbi:MAG: hypothetical protein R3C10_12195 [Pirellulales bacterium]
MAAHLGGNHRPGRRDLCPPGVASDRGNGALDAEAGKSFLATVRGRWSKVLHTAILVLIISGVYNVSQTIGDRPPVYHMVFTLKLLLALAIFFFAIALTGRSQATQKLRDHTTKWLTVVVVLGVIVVCLSGFLRFVPPKSAEPAAPADASIQSPTGENTLPAAVGSTIVEV